MSVTKIPVAGLALSDSFSGVLETNATFVDQAIFGPSVDGKSWNGKWSVASLYSSLMLVTIEDAGSDTQVNIWDLTEQSGGAPSTTPLGTVTLSGDATPTSVAACMGYIIVGSEDGISIIDPHGGSWAERTSGWPKSLSTSTSPALVNNDVDQVLAFTAPDTPFDPRTGGNIPYFIAGYGAGTSTKSIIMPNGNVYDDTYDSGATNLALAEMYPGIVYQMPSTNIMTVTLPLATITADGTLIQSGINVSNGPGVPTGVTCGAGNKEGMIAFGGTSGLDYYWSDGTTQSLQDIGGGGDLTAALRRSQATRAYNTGHMVGDIRGAWLANSKTVDRSYKANTLTENGTVTEAAVETSAELMGYSGFSDTTNWFSQAYDADLDFGTGDYSFAYWFKRNGSTGSNFVMRRTQSPAGGAGLIHAINPGGSVNAQVTDGSDEVNISTGGAFGDNEWHMTVTTWDGTAKTLSIYVDGVFETSGTNASVGTLSNGSAILTIGGGVGGAEAADQTALSLVRISATNPTATQIRQMYDAEKPMFVASAECLLQSGSTDAVLDVDVDKLTGKVLVTQTDAITVFSGLAVDSKPTVNSGSSEKGKLWGDLRAEQNSANAYVTAPATDQRQVNEMVRGLASDLPAGVDLSKCSAWLELDGTGTISITSSYNIKSVTDLGTGSYEVFFATPFKSRNYVAVGSGGQTNNDYMVAFYKQSTKDVKKSIEWCSTKASTAALVDNNQMWCAFFGELENE